MSRLNVNLRGKYGDDTLSHYPHHICIGPNLHAKDRFFFGEELMSDQTYYKTSPFDCTLPLPLLPMRSVPKSFLNGIDPVKRIVEEKGKWQELLNHELKYASKYCDTSVLKNLQKNVVKNDTVNEIHRGLFILAKTLDIDPDDQFDGFYNWYYSGGNVNHINIRGNEHLLHSVGKKFNVLEAVPLLQGENVYMVADTRNRIRYSLDSKDPILQIISSPENKFVGVRQRKKCVIFYLSGKLHPSFTKLDEVLSLKPFTSIDFDKAHERYVMMKTDSSCCIRDLGASKIVKQWKVPDCSNKYVDKWCSAFFGQNRDTIVCINRRFLRTYDARAKNMNCMELCPANGSTLLENCEEISCAVEGCCNVDHPLMYVATYHHLLAMDLRFPRAFVQRWSHSMKHGPCYLSTSMIRNADHAKRTEVVLLGSQFTKEIHAVINEFSANDSFDKGFSSVFPISLPSEAETLSLAHWHGKLLNPSVQKRLSAVTTGICCFEGEGITCFRSNSVGDIFQQHLLLKYSRHQIELPNVLENISKWQKSKPKKHNKKLETVTLMDCKKLFERITGSEIKMPQKINVKRGKEKWKISKYKSFSHTDMLAHKILKVWEVEDEDEWDEDLLEDLSVLPPSQEPTDKVQEWLGQNDYASTPMASQETYLEDTSQLNLSLSPIIDRGVSERKSLLQRKSLQKKRFVHGF